VRAVVQRVTRARVTVDGETVGSIENGLLVLVGVKTTDGEAEAGALAEKCVGLRIFEDDAGKMNRDVREANGSVLAVSQFTLLGDVRKGKRPSFTGAMEPAGASRLFEAFVGRCRALGVEVETGRFRAHMAVELVNDGPVTILVDTEKAF
jgi:D-tyrosyl-tRNA(Tyr) deacylase